MSATSTESAAIALPRHRGHPFDPPAEYRALREERPVCPLAFPDGRTGWLLTRYQDVRDLLADDRFSSDPRRLSMPVRALPIREDDPRLRGSFIGMDPPEHTRYRRLLARWFTVRRTGALAPRIERITADHLDAMQAAGPPADLVEAFARPIPSLVICELLGVPYADRAAFQGWAATMLRIDESLPDVFAARDAAWDYLHDLIAAKRRQPDGALLSGLISGDGGDGQAPPLTDEELTGVGMLLLLAGHETTANMLALGSYALLRHPEQARIVRERPQSAGQAVEELLRYLTIVHFGVIRAARQDVRIAGALVSAGQTVLGSLAAANRDPARFPDPDALDIGRDAAPHLAFGHGIHQCLGQHLARLEMRIGYPALLRRFPALRLAVPAEEVPMRDDMFVYGVHRLPVTWEA